jgi:hypothetical protein
MRTEEFPAGTVIFRAGSASACAYRIRKGTVELVGPNDATPARLVELGPGDVFGEMSLIEERPHSLTARAVTAVELSSMTMFAGSCADSRVASPDKTLWSPVWRVRSTGGGDSRTSTAPLDRTFATYESNDDRCRSGANCESQFDN